MPPIQIELPKHPIFETELHVRVGDCNYGGHLGNDSVLSLCHEARFRFFWVFGQREDKFFGSAIIVNYSSVLYKNQGILGDPVRIIIGIEDVSSAGFDVIYSLVHKEKGHEIARAVTGIACINYTTGKPEPLPQACADLLRSKGIT